MYHIARNHENVSHPHAIRILNNFQGFTRKTLNQLEENEFVEVTGTNWAMTEKGYLEAESIFNQIGTEND